MKRIRLTEADLYKIVKKVIKEDEEAESESEIMNSELYSELSDNDIQEWNSNKMGWIKAIKECLADLDKKYNTTRYSKLPRKYIPILAFLVLVFSLGISKNITELKLMGLMTLLGTVVLSHVELQEILICASSKRKGNNISQEDINNDIRKMINKMSNPSDNTEVRIVSPSNSMIESVIKKSLRKVIREEESLPFALKKTVQDIINTKRFNELQEGMMVSVKNNIVTILPGGSESDEQYVVDIRPKTFQNMEEQQTKMMVKSGKLNIKFINGKILSLEPSMKVTKFNP